MRIGWLVLAAWLAGCVDDDRPDARIPLPDLDAPLVEGADAGATPPDAAALD
jgi:hypothetical protein